MDDRNQASRSALSIVAVMSWVGAKGWARRPLVVVEDHLQHVTELLAALAAVPEAADRGAARDGAAGPPLLALTTVLCLDRAGPDTSRLVAHWLAAYPTLQVAARLAPGDLDPREERAAALDPAVFDSANRFAKALGSLLRPRGLLLQDVQLETLRFLPKDRWWESIYLASTVRGMFAENPPTCRFLSNKRGYEATFGRDLLEAGFDPRDVMDKSEIRETVVPVVRSYLDRTFPWQLAVAPTGERVHAADVSAVAKTEEDRREVERELDLVAWCGDVGGTAAGIELGGRILAGEGDRRRLTLKAGSQEAVTWSELIADRLANGEGVPVLAVGQRIAPEGAGRAEITNLAARHLHGLRSRLADPAGIVTAHHAYRLAPGLKVGRVTARTA